MLHLVLPMEGHEFMGEAEPALRQEFPLKQRSSPFNRPGVDP